MQLRCLSAISLEKILATFPRKTPTDLDVFNSVYLQMKPLAFAANASRHLFSRPGPERFANRVINGDVDFPAWALPE